MQALDLSKVQLLKFNAYYALLSGAYILISSIFENKFMSNLEFPFTSGLLYGLIIQFCILNVRIILMQKNFRNIGEIQTASTFLSIIINLIALLLLITSENNFKIILGFFIAHNLNILNIALITNLSVKKND